MEGTLIVAILALLVALGGLGLGIANYFHARKVDKRAAKISEDQDKLSFEQRKQEVLNILQEAELSLRRAKVLRRSSANKLAGMEQTVIALAVIEEQIQIVSDIGTRVKQPMSRIELEKDHGRALELKTFAKAIEANTEQMRSLTT